MGPRTGTDERYSVALGDLWSGLARTLTRLDVNPQIRFPFKKWQWFTVNSTASWRDTFYTRSLSPVDLTTAVDDPLSRRFFTLETQIVGPVVKRLVVQEAEILTLMFPAVVGCSSKDDRPPDRRTAGRAWATLLAVLDEVARRIACATRLPGNDGPQNAPHGAVDRLHLEAAELIDGPPRMHRRLMQNLVRVEIADPGDHVLRHQQ